MSSQDVESISDSPILPRLGKNSPILSYFCVYNPSLSTNEDNTKDQILYYTAKKVVPADVKMKQVGLAQALVNFSSTFSPSHPTQNVHSQKNRMIFLQPEPGFWMHMCVELGILRKQIKDSKGKEKLVTEYLDSQLNDVALEAVLKIGYEQFKLLNGTFKSILYGDSKEQPNRQRTRSLMHAIEEFFSEWIWKWDFDRLDIMCFSAVFNGVPVQPVLRTNYLRINQLDTLLQQRFNISHTLILQDGLVYRSPTLHIQDTCSLLKYVLKKVDKYYKDKKRKSDIDLTKQQVKLSGLKQFTKSISTSQILNYFSSGSKSTSTEGSPASSINETTLPAPTDIPTAPQSPNLHDTVKSQGIFLTGLIETTAIGMNGEERPVTKSELVRVYISSSSSDDDNDTTKDTLIEYYILVYKHKSGLIWNFLLPATSQSESLISDPSFYTQLESHLTENKLDELTSALTQDFLNMQEKSLNLGKNYKCFYYDNTTLTIKSTMNKQVTNDMLLQLLEIKQDFEQMPRTEVYTRSTANHWIAGHRLYNSLRESSSEDEDYTEMYLIAAKKDTSLADVEETLGKMTTTLLDTMHIE